MFYCKNHPFKVAIIILLILLSSMMASAESQSKSVLIINDDNDYHFDDDKSVEIFQSAFTEIGYNVKIEKSDKTSNSTWNEYDIIVWSSGDDVTPVYDPEYKEMLVDYVTNGGHLIIESGHVASWIKRFGDQIIDREFREKVLHATTNWVYSNVSTLKLSSQHPIATTPNALPQSIGFTPTNQGDDSGDADAVRILPDAVGICTWSNVDYRGNPVNENITSISFGLMVYDNDENPANGGQIVYFAFDIDDIDNSEMQKSLIKNSENWIIPTGPTPTPTPIPKSILIINDDNDIHFDDDKSVNIFKSAFNDMGYDVKIEKSEETTYSTWGKYDIVVWSSGDDATPIYDPEYKEILIDYVNDGGYLIIESGHIASWIKRFGDQSVDRELREKVLHVTTNWVYSDASTLKLSGQHPIATTPNALPQSIGFTPTNPGDDSGDADAVRILSDATGVYNWANVAYRDNPIDENIARKSYGLIVYDNTVNNGGRIVYYAFDLDDIDTPEIQDKLIKNSENWLLKIPKPTPTPTETEWIPFETETKENPGFEIAFAAFTLLLAFGLGIRNRTRKI